MALTRQYAIDKHNELVKETTETTWEPVSMGTRLEDARVQPNTSFLRSGISEHVVGINEAGTQDVRAD